MKPNVVVFAIALICPSAWGQGQPQNTTPPSPDVSHSVTCAKTTDQANPIFPVEHCEPSWPGPPPFDVKNPQIDIAPFLLVKPDTQHLIPLVPNPLHIPNITPTTKFGPASPQPSWDFHFGTPTPSLAPTPATPGSNSPLVGIASVIANGNAERARRQQAAINWRMQQEQKNLTNEQRLLDDMLALTQMRGSRDLSQETKDKFDAIRREACGVKNQIQHSIVDEQLFESTLRDLDDKPRTCAELTK